MEAAMPTDQHLDLDALRAADKPVLIDFSAPWCPPCRMLKPVIEKLARTQAHTHAIRFVDVDQQPELAQTFAVANLPTLVLVQRGEELGRLVGFHSEPDIRRFLAAHGPITEDATP
jgi:thioredoxin 1